MDERMDERIEGQSSRQSASTWLHRDGPWLIVLLLLVGLLRGWLLINTEVTARDSIGFIRYALQFDHRSWSDCLNNQHQHPGYPVAMWLVAKPIRLIWGTTPESMRIAAQLTSILAALALAAMMFRLGSYLWDRYIGFFGALLLQCFPIPGHHLSDGISDGLFLFLTISALDALIRAWDTGSVRRYAWGGVLVGLAYLTRPEGLLVLPAAFLFCVALQCTKNHRKSWREIGTGLAAMTAACMIAGSPYPWATGHLTIKPSALEVMKEAAFVEAPSQTGGPLFASLFAANFTPASNGFDQLQRTLRALLFELGQALNYVGAFFAIWALLFCRGTLTRHPGFYLLTIYFLIHASILVKLGLKVSYVSDRHVMALVALGCYLCIIGLMHFQKLWVIWLKSSWTPPPGFIAPRVVYFATTAWLMVALSICVGKTVTRLHGNRVGNHEAGLWLAGVVKAGDFVEDDHTWSQYYAGQVFVEPPNNPLVAPDVTPRHFVVMTRSKDDEVRETRESREKALKSAKAEIVYYWPPASDLERARIVIYSMPRNYETHPWEKAESRCVIQQVNWQK